jgi:hypothetical protein
MSDLHTTATFGLIDHIRALDDRIGRIEMHLFPHDGSGSERYGDAGDWTQSEGKGLTDNTSAALPAGFEIIANANKTYALVKDGKAIGIFPSRFDAEKAAAVGR